MGRSRKGAARLLAGTAMLMMVVTFGCLQAPLGDDGELLTQSSAAAQPKGYLGKHMKVPAIPRMKVGHGGLKVVVSQ